MKCCLLLLLILQIFQTIHSQNEVPSNDRTNRQKSGNSNYNLNTSSSLNESFDFIIIGAGNAGSVLANRLTEIDEWKILLLEIGDEPTFLTEVPIMAPLLQFTNFNWNYLMEKQENLCLGLTDQRMAWPKGRALGGTSIINYMIHIRGNRYDYNRWAKLGNPGWSYKDVFKYFLKSENATLANQDAGYHSSYGFLNVQDVPFRTKSANIFIKAAQEAGYPYVDYNGRKQLGVSYVQATLRDGRRCSGEKAFLQPIKNRKNLKILTKSRAVKILIEPITKKAYGVRYIKNRQYYTAIARKEVISSAGSLLSPQLLMLSGIGPKKHLEEIGIKVLQDLPVGQKLYDHLTFGGLFFTVNDSIVQRNQNDFIDEPKDIITFLAENKGLLTTLGGVEALLYLQTNVTKEKKPIPDIELIFLAGSMHTDKGRYYRKTFRYTDEIYNTVWKPLENRNIWTILPMPLHPKSYGHIKLKSKNPFHLPKFYGNYFTDPNNFDIKTFIAGIRQAQKINEMPAFQKYNSQMVRTSIPGCETFQFDSDDYWECALRHLATTLHHQIATCKMGPKTDPEAIVDNKLRVYGIKQLRIVDAGIIPITLSAHISIPTYMVAEKAADLIKEEWLNHRHQG